MASMDLLFRFIGADAGAGAEFDRMAGKAGLTGKALGGLAIGAATAGAAVAVESIKMAATFQTSMTRIHTQADASNKTVAALSRGILSMAGSVAETPATLAAAAYHIASFGQKSLTTAQQLKVLKVATEGAKLGGADLVDVTNALDGVLATHVKGVQNYTQAMGALNATVGAGDMTMQDLADALPKVGITAKQAGISLTEMGAALAVFGDNNLRGALAGTALRMSIQALEKPATTGVAALNAIGISSTQLAKDMQQGGLTKAIDDLHKHMVKAGDTGKRVGAFLTDAFGKKAGQGLGYLEGELGRFHNKIGEVGKGATGFASSWQGYTKTFGYAWDSAKASAQSLFIELGTKLLPVATRFMNWVSRDAIPGLGKFASWIKQHVAPVVGGILKDAIEGAENAFHRISGAIADNKSSLMPLWQTFKAVAGFIVTKLIPAIGPMLGGAIEISGMAWAVSIKVLARVIDAGRAVVRFFTGPFIHGIGEMVSMFIRGLKFIADAAMTAFGVIVHGASSALGWVPGIGGKLKGAARAFDNFKASVDGTLSSIAAKAAGWGEKTGSGLAHGILTGIALNITAVEQSAHNLGWAAAKSAAYGAQVKSPSKYTIYVGKMLAEGLIGGWTGEAGRLKNALTTGVQNALNHLESITKAALDKQTATLKASRSKLADALKARAADTRSLAGTIAGGTDLSGLFGTDANGNPTVANIGTFLGGQIPGLKQFAGDEKWAKNHHLSKVALAALANLGAVQGDQVLKQLMSGQTSIAAVNQDYKLIHKYSTSAATTAEDALYKGVLTKDRAAVHEQTKATRELTHAINELKREAAHDVARNVTVTTDGKRVEIAGLTTKEARVIEAALHRLGHRGVKVATKK